MLSELATIADTLNMTVSQMIPDRYAQLQELIETEQLYPHFQPIVDLRRGEVLGQKAIDEINPQHANDRPCCHFQAVRGGYIGSSLC
ncbi:hypothetical protein Q4508_10740 [Amphritea sp. 2_MG-2023]|uniref:hypothetical protein n=1 Tax=Amphritea TaxID=515417 RepID=UPI001C06F5CF|nr:MULTISPECIES: hypothetical protein [Amphritea]MBU2967547.1 hypothetical protein [Amphritea atlantica]MDO6419035.1 hypothetical protein [Amphritea sp. 2_MG-2023]